MANRQNCDAPLDGSQRGRPDGGSQYVRPTGEGFLGTFRVSEWCCAVNMVSAGLDRTTTCTVTVVDDRTARIATAAPDEPHLERKPVTDTGYLELTSATLTHLDASDGDDLRLYEGPETGYLVVRAADDPFVDEPVTDGGSRPVREALDVLPTADVRCYQREGRLVVVPADPDPLRVGGATDGE